MTLPITQLLQLSRTKFIWQTLLAAWMILYWKRVKLIWLLFNKCSRKVRLSIGTILRKVCQKEVCEKLIIQIICRKLVIWGNGKICFPFYLHLFVSIWQLWTCFTSFGLGFIETMVFDIRYFDRRMSRVIRLQNSNYWINSMIFISI